MLQGISTKIEFSIYIIFSDTYLVLCSKFELIPIKTILFQNFLKLLQMPYTVLKDLKHIMLFSSLSMLCGKSCI